MSSLVLELDAADRLILDEASALMPGADVVVIGSAALAVALPDARVHLDSVVDENAAANAVGVEDGDAPNVAGRVGRSRPNVAGRVGRSRPYRDLTPDLLTGATLVLLRLPKSLAELDRIARAVAQHASPDVVLVAGARLKYMSLGMNEVLARSFGRVDVSLARQKSRVLIARQPLTGARVDAGATRLAELDLVVEAVGGVFAGSSLDIGTRALLATFNQLPAYETAIDLGCGTGILAAQLKRSNPAARVIATDASASAVASAAATMAANRLDVDVIRDAGLGTQPDNSADLIVLNPPFHDGGAITKDIALELFAEAGRVLRPGGELWSVWNSHLGYRAPLARLVGQTRQIARTAKFTVTASTKQLDNVSSQDLQEN